MKVPQALVEAGVLRPRLVQRRDERQDYETPWDLFEALSREFGPFDIDVAASAANTKCARFWTKEDNALIQDWTGLRCYMNPEYRIARAFCKKAAAEKARTCALLPARTDTKWFHESIWDAENDRPRPNVVKFRPLKGRVKFTIDGKPILDPKTGKPAGGKFPSMVVVWDNLQADQAEPRLDCPHLDAPFGPTCPQCLKAEAQECPTCYKPVPDGTDYRMDRTRKVRWHSQCHPERAP